MHTISRTESDVQTFWTASQIWRGTILPPKNAPKTYGELLHVLTPISESAKSQALRTQADDLAMLVIHAKRRRKKQPALGKSKVTKLRLVTNNSGLAKNTSEIAA